MLNFLVMVLKIVIALSIFYLIKWLMVSAYEFLLKTWFPIEYKIPDVYTPPLDLEEKDNDTVAPETKNVPKMKNPPPPPKRTTQLPGVDSDQVIPTEPQIIKHL